METLPQVTANVPRTWDRPWVMLPLFALIAVVGGHFGSFTVRANVLVLSVGGALMWLGLSGRTARRPVPRSVPSAAAWWLVPILMLALVELVAFGLQNDMDYPTLSSLTDPSLDRYLPRVVGYFAWLAVFWWWIRR